MLCAIGETAAEIEGCAGPSLGGDKLKLTAEGFLFHYTLDLQRRRITVYSVRPVIGAVG